MEKDSLVIVDRTDQEILAITNIIANSPINDAFILGENDDQDNINGGKGNDVIESLGGNDTLRGDNFNIDSYKGDDTLDGGKGNDFLDGRKGRDVAVFSDDFENYDYEISESIFGGYDSITFEHIGGTQTDGTDTLKNIEWAQFQDTLKDLGTLTPGNSSTVSRIVPLPLEEGEAETVSIQTTDTTTNPNIFDPPTPPHVSLTAPVSMLDGDIDYTLNISPFKPDTQYNIVYIIDTSASMDAAELQAVKDAYIDLTNYFVDNELAENINFGVVSFGREAAIQKDLGNDQNLNANEAITAIQNLSATNAIGTNIKEGLYQGFNFLSMSPVKPATRFSPTDTTSISYFFADGKHTVNTGFTTLVDESKRLRRFSNVQAFGLKDSLDPGTVSEDEINFADSNDGVIINDPANLSSELQKSGLAEDVEEVKILVDDEVVQTLTPDQLTDSPLGLTFEGTVEDLDVSVDAENLITAEVVYTPESNLATTTVDFTVTSGESTGETSTSIADAGDGDGNGNGNEEDTEPDPFKIILEGSESDDTIRAGYTDLGISGGAGSDRLNIFYLLNLLDIFR